MLLEYIWLDKEGNHRSKTKVYNKQLPNNVEDLPDWNYDGSSTGQAPGNDSEVIIKPRAMFNDPFKREVGKLILCDTWLPNGDAHKTNTRHKAQEIFNHNKHLKPLFGIEQEFFLYDNKKDCPIGFSEDIPEPQGKYYCGIGNGYAIGRECIDEAFDNCLYAGLQLTGLNAEVAPSQWEFQVCAYGIDAADQLIVMRYIIDRTAEPYEYNLNIQPKPLKGDWNGSGCHTNFSTEPMRKEGGWDVIINSINKLEKKHDYHMENYGEGNRDRMTGLHETASYDKFSWGIADRGSCIRIPRETEKNKCGYFEDRRPASNMDPYRVTSLIFETTSL